MIAAPSEPASVSIHSDPNPVAGVPENHSVVTWRVRGSIRDTGGYVRGGAFLPMTTEVLSTHSDPSADTTVSGPDPTVTGVAVSWLVVGLTETTSPRGP